MDKNNIELINNIGFWKSKITISPVEGGITNQNFLVNDGSRKYFVRIGDDIPEHLVFRSNEIQASNAASKISVSPELLFHDKSIQVFNFIDGKTLDSTDIKNNLEQITKLIKKVHSKMPDQLVGQSVIFWVFYVIKNYKNFLEKNNSAYIKILPELLEKSSKLEIVSAPFDIVFSHNDLLPANFIENKDQIWLIDWEYAGFNTPLFDLGGLSSNNQFSEQEEKQLLENYFEKKLTSDFYFKYKAIKCASLLRETMWSMVSEITSKIDFDYKSYTADNIIKFNKAFDEEFKIN